MMLRKRFVVVIALLALSAGAAIASRVQVVEQWALYTSSDPKQPVRLFLEPFPSDKFCEDDAVAVVHDGGHAECRKRLSYTLDRGPADRLLWEFLTEWGHICGPRRVAVK
ncbi:MAG: hypothetical protein WBD74_03520 [Candidatus Aquilonibacter sp.]